MFYCGALAVASSVAVAESAWASRVPTDKGSTANAGSATALRPSVISIGNAMQSFVVDVSSPDSIIIENSSGIYVSTNTGDRWTRIFDADAVTLTHIVGIISFGTKNIWLREIGDARYDFVPYTRDGGKTWETSTLPGGANNPDSIVFANPNVGTLVADEATANGGGSARFDTTNGGRTWVRASSTTSIPIKPLRPSPVANGKAPAGLRIQQTYFASPGLSWAVALYRSGSLYLLRSSDGGRQWSLVPN